MGARHRGRSGHRGPQEGRQRAILRRLYGPSAPSFFLPLSLLPPSYLGILTATRHRRHVDVSIALLLLALLLFRPALLVLLVLLLLLHLLLLVGLPPSSLLLPSPAGGGAPARRKGEAGSGRRGAGACRNKEVGAEGAH